MTVQLRLGKHLVGHVRLIVGQRPPGISSLRRRSSNWPFFTSSPKRAKRPTIRPEASEMTGTVRSISGFTVPVTASCAVCTVLHRRSRRILVRAVNGKFLRLVGRGDLGRRRRSGSGIGLSPLAGSYSAISMAVLRTTRPILTGILCTLAAEANMLKPPSKRILRPHGKKCRRSDSDLLHDAVSYIDR